jgi:hypothetical protein
VVGVSIPENLDLGDGGDEAGRDSGTGGYILSCAEEDKGICMVVGA